MIELEQPTEVKAPFPGLRPFEKHERSIFFGRDGLSDVLLSKLRAARFVSVVGTSGSGKSSLVRAGLLPALEGGFMVKAGSRWRVALFRPGNNPIANLAAALAEAGICCPDGRDGGAGADALERSLRNSSLGLVDAVRGAALSPYENLLVVVDQFEELYRFEPLTEGQDPKEEAAAFVKLLLEAAQKERMPIYTILTMRSEYLGHSAQFWGLPEAINRGQFLIPRMDDDDRREAIAGPARVFGTELSSPLVNRLVNDAGDDPAQLPILQHALMRTWDHWKALSEDGPRERTDSIDIEHYEAVGGMAHALSRHAGEAYAGLISRERQEIARKMFKRLTDKGAGATEGRLPATVAEIAAIAQADVAEVVAVIEEFRKEGRSFLMPPQPRPLTPDTLIDISHESLIRGWDLLGAWVEEEEESRKHFMRLVDAAQSYPVRTGLLTDPALQVILDWRRKQQWNEAWASRYSPNYDLAIDYLEKSAAKARRRRRNMAALAAAVVLMLLGISAALLVLWNTAATRAIEAVAAELVAEDRRKSAAEAAAEAAKERNSAVAARLTTDVARLDAEVAREEAEKARKVADEKAREAVRHKDIAVAEQRKAQIQAERGNLLEAGMIAALSGDDQGALKNLEGLKSIYTRGLRQGSDQTKPALADILIGNIIMDKIIKDANLGGSMDSEDQEVAAALKRYQSSLGLSQNGKAKLPALALVSIGDRIIHEDVPIDSMEAAPFYRRALELTPAADINLKARTLEKLGDVYLEDGIYRLLIASTREQRQEATEKATLGLDYYRRAQQDLKDDNPGKARIYEKLGDGYAGTPWEGGPAAYADDAENSYKRSAEVAVKSKSYLIRGNALRKRGRLSLNTGKIGEALKHLNAALAAYEEIPASALSGSSRFEASLGLGYTVGDIGKVYEQRRDIDAAIKSYQRARDEFKDLARSSSRLNKFRDEAEREVLSLEDRINALRAAQTKPTP